MTKECEICGNDVTIRIEADDTPIILMYQSSDFYVTRKGVLRPVRNRKIKYLCQICRQNYMKLFGVKLR